MIKSKFKFKPKDKKLRTVLGDIPHDSNEAMALLDMTLAEHIADYDDPHGATLEQSDFVAKKPWCDVRAFGATGDGTTDDTTAIQDAIDSLTDAGIVFLPEGTYKITSAIQLDDSILLKGVGGSTLITSTGNHDLIVANNKTKAGVEFLALSGGDDGITIYGGSSQCFVRNVFVGAVGNNGIFLNDAKNCQVRGNIVNSPSKNGIYIYGTTDPALGSDENNVIGNLILSPGNKGISVFNNSERNRIIGNYLYHTGEAGIFLNDTSSSYHSNYNSVIGNTVYRSGATEDSGGNGIEFGAEQVGAICKGNFVIEAGYGRAGEALPSMYGISVHGKHIIVQGNYVLSALYHGIYLYEASFVVCTGNIVINSSQDSAGNYDGIRVHSSSGEARRIIIDHNICLDNQGTPRQAYGIRVTGSNTSYVLIGDHNITYGNATGHISNLTATSFADGDTTPSIANGRVFKVNYSSSTTITDFDDGYNGQIICLAFTNANVTVQDGGNFQLNGNFYSTAGDTLMLMMVDGVWKELSRSAN